MLIYEYKLDGKKPQYAAIDEAIRVVQFIRNICLRTWIDGRGVRSNDLQCYCAVLAQEYLFAARLNSQARQASADRAWAAISRFYENCKHHKPGKKGYPRFQHDNRSVEYKTTGWRLEPDGKHITFTDGCGIGTLRLVGNNKQEVATFPLKQIKRVRLVRRADGYYCQFAVQAQRTVKHVSTGRPVGIDVGLKTYYTDSDGNTVNNPRYYRKTEKRLKRLHRRLSRKQKKSANRKKAQKRVAKAYLKVSRQREDFARKQANALVSSHDFLAYEDLKIRNLLRNRHLSKSISDACLRHLLAVGEVLRSRAWHPRHCRSPAVHDAGVFGVWDTGQKESLSPYPHLSYLWARSGSRRKCGVEYPACWAQHPCSHGFCPYPGAQGNLRAFGKRFWTDCLYSSFSWEEDGQAGWMKEEPPCF